MAMGQGDGIRERWRTCENALELALQVFGVLGFMPKDHVDVVGASHAE
jgi:hypothetical protein